MEDIVSLRPCIGNESFPKRIQDCTCLASVHCVFLSFVTRGQDGSALPAVMAIDGW